MTETTENWKLEGDYFEACNCEAACPCVWLSPPTEGDCRLLVVWHIERGHYGDTALDGLNVALACHAPGVMISGGWQAALYLDDRASAEQQTALTRIFSGAAGGHMAVLMALVDKVLGVKTAPIHYESDGRVRRLSIAQIAEARIEAVKGGDGGETTVANPPLCIVSSHPSVVAKSSDYRYQDFGFDWHYSDRNGYYSRFVYAP